MDTRPPHILQIDEFQTYANMGFANMLTQGRSYRVSSVLATQNRSLIGANAGKDAKNFMDLVSTNARNVVIYPGANYEDASYYSRQFGEVTEREIERGISRPVQSLAYGFDGLGRRPNESIREVEKTKARFSPNDITYRPFGEVTIGIIKNNSIQAPVAAKLSFIDYSVKKEMDKMIEKYQADRKLGWEILRREESLGGESPKDAYHDHKNDDNGTINDDKNSRVVVKKSQHSENNSGANQNKSINGVKNSQVDVDGYEFDDVFSNVPSKDMVKDSWGEENNQKIQQKPVVSKKIQSNREIYSDNF